MKNKIEPNENIVYKCKPHWCVLIWPAIISILTFIISFIIILPSLLIDGFGSYAVIEGIISLLLCIVISICIFAIPFLKFKTNKLILTDKRIFGKVGIIKTTSLTAPISKIQTVNIHRGLFGRIFGYSDITIHCITGIYIFKKQTNAEEMQNLILNAIK